jgi:hypothetical protein
MEETKMRFSFKHSEEVYDYITHVPDAWSRGMLEHYMEDIMDVENFDAAELNQWLEDELSSIQEGYEEFLDEGERE